MVKALPPVQGEVAEWARRTGRYNDQVQVAQRPARLPVHAPESPL